MKNKIYFLFTILCILSFSAQAQRFGDDILLHECGSEFRIEPKISVADNGWIYVLMNKHSESSAETRIYRSIDGGATFEQIMYQDLPSGTTQGGRDFVVTGDNASNIKLWYVYADNNTATGVAHVYLKRMDADGTNATIVHSYEFNNTVNHDVAISTNARSPKSSAWGPFVIGYAVSSNSNSSGYIDYSYSTDGGTTFTRKLMYSKIGSEFGSIDLSIGQADENIYYPMAGIVFEMDRESEKNIGFIAAQADGSNNTTALQVNKLYSTVFETKQPAIQWLCNNTLDEPFNFMIAYSSFYNDYGEEDWDVLRVFPKPDYNLSAHTLSNLGWSFVAGFSFAHDECADITYDKVNNNYLIVFSQNSGTESKLDYRMVSYIDAVGDQEFPHIAFVSTSSVGTYEYYSPVIDIDPTRTEVCFAHELFGYNTTQLLFDSEWSPVGVEEIVATNENLNIFPNPATDKITLRMREEGVYFVRMYNMFGAEVATFEYSGTAITYNVTNLPSGLYLVKLSSEKGKEFTAKFVVK